jgi:hypothetical protein
VNKRQGYQQSRRVGGRNVSSTREIFGFHSTLTYLPTTRSHNPADLISFMVITSRSDVSSLWQLPHQWKREYFMILNCVVTCVKKYTGDLYIAAA